MAYIRTAPKDEQQSQQMNAAAGLMGADTPQGAAAGAPPPPEPGPQQQPGTGFVGIKQYLDLNQGAGQQMGQTAANTITDATGKATTAMQEGESAAQADIAKATVTPDDAVIQAAIANPFGPEAEQVKAWRTATYQDPTQTTDYFAGAEAPINTATQKAELTKTEGGKGELVKDVYGGQFTQGGLGLDAALLGQNQGVLDTAAAGTTGLYDALNAAAGRTGEASQAAREASGANIGAMNTTLAKSITDYLSGIDTRVTAAQAARDAASKALSSGATLTPAQMSALGITPEQAKSLSDLIATKGIAIPRFGLSGMGGVTPGAYTSHEAMTRGEVMSPEDVAYYKALAEMGGSTPETITSVKPAEYDFTKALEEMGSAQRSILKYQPVAPPIKDLAMGDLTSWAETNAPTSKLEANKLFRVLGTGFGALNPEQQDRLTQIIRSYGSQYPESLIPASIDASGNVVWRAPTSEEIAERAEAGGWGASYVPGTSGSMSHGAPPPPSGGPPPGFTGGAGYGYA